MLAVCPDLAFLFAAFTFLYVLTFYDGPTQLFRDSDAGWHIRNGEAIVTQGMLPRTDPYSFSRAGAPWYAWEWGADAMMGAAHLAGGLRAVALLYATLIAACAWLWVRWQYALGVNFWLICALAAPMLTTTNLHWLARPHVFGWALTLGWLAALERRNPGLPAAAVLGAVWANVHGSFVLAAGLPLLWAAGLWLGARVWKLDDSRARGLLAVAGAAAAGTLLNPYGWELHRHVTAYLMNADLLARIAEFQSFNFHAEGAGQIVLTVLICAAGIVLAAGQKRPAHALLLVVFTAGALRAARGLPLLALAGLPLAAAAITKALEQARDLRPGIRSWLDGALQYGANLRRLEMNAGGWAWAPVVVLLGWFYLSVPAVAARTGFPAKEFPVQAAAHVPPDARLMAPDKFGGYLIYRFAGRMRVFFDGRSDFYGLEFMKEYVRLVEVRPGWQAIFDRYGFTHALLPNNYSLIPALDARGWKRVHADGTATLLAREIK
jgi:hypothetical protein